MKNPFVDETEKNEASQCHSKSQRTPKWKGESQNQAYCSHNYWDNEEQTVVESVPTVLKPVLQHRPHYLKKIR